jgi:hypothetical protein
MFFHFSYFPPTTSQLGKYLHHNFPSDVIWWIILTRNFLLIKFSTEKSSRTSLSQIPLMWKRSMKSQPFLEILFRILEVSICSWFSSFSSFILLTEVFLNHLLKCIWWDQVSKFIFGVFRWIWFEIFVFKLNWDLLIFSPPF